MSCPINNLKSQMLFTGRNCVFSDLTWKKKILLQEMVGGSQIYGI